MTQHQITPRMLRGFPPHIQATNKINKSGPTFFSIHMEPVCNFRCLKCFHSEQKGLIGKHQILDISEVRKIMENAAMAGAKSFGITGAGEPLLDKKFINVIKAANEFGFITHMATNSSMLTRETAECLLNNNVTLVLSLDTLDKTEFAKFTKTRPEMFDRVIENIMDAQEVFKGTKETITVNGQNTDIHRIAIHMTVHEIKSKEIDKLKKIVLPDTLFSLSPLANIGWAAETGLQSEIGTRMNQELSEKHITIWKDPKSNAELCGFFKFGADINFDGQLLLDSHAMETRNLFPNIRDFNFDIKLAFHHMKAIKEEFIRTHLDGFCAIRSKRIAEWIDEKQAELDLKAQNKNIIGHISKGKSLLKFAFLGKGADRFLKVTQSKEYHTARIEKEILASNKPALREFVGKRNTVVLGVGDGQKLKHIIEDEPGTTLVDISAKLLEISKNAVSSPKLMEADMDDLTFNEFKKGSIFIMLGNTLGNIENKEEFLEKIKSVQNSSLIIGIELIKGAGQENMNKIIDEYKNENGFEFVFTPLESIRIKREMGKISVKFNEKTKNIEEFFEFESKEELNKFAMKTGITPKQAEKILLSTSTKMSRGEFLALIEACGFKVRGVFSNGTNFMFLLSQNEEIAQKAGDKNE